VERADFGWVTTAAPTASAELDPEVQQHVEQSRAHASARLRLRARRGALTIAAGFAAAVALLVAFAPSDRSPSILTVAVLVGAYVLASRVEFEVRTALALPTQLVLVPMLFLLPLAYVPLFVAGGLLLGRVPDFVRGRVPLDRALLVAPNAWHSLGPVTVLVLTGERAPSLDDLPIYLGALAAQFAVEFACAGPFDWYVNGVAPTSQLPFMGWAVLVDTALAPIGLAVALAAQGHPVAVLLVLPLVGLLAEFARERRARIDHALELSHAYRGTALLLGDVVEADDAYTGSHSRDVVSLVLDVCDRLELSARERRDAEFAALLHDVGKIKVPSEIINKPGKLTDAEWAVVKAHTIEGEKLLSQVGGLLGNVGRIVRSCHEDWDGTGYPDGLASDQIPLVARIVRCCDAFSAMTTDRPYRKARPVAEAVAELRHCAGSDFDPAVVEALSDVLEQPSAELVALSH
jgi:HD-GYP domain-containing protein (c-di-GMP phosphodiesterase class II)